jgi:hypothetical protein
MIACFFGRGGGDNGFRGGNGLFVCGDETLLFGQRRHRHFNVAHFGGIAIADGYKNPDCPGFRNTGNFTFRSYWPLD